MSIFPFDQMKINQKNAHTLLELLNNTLVMSRDLFGLRQNSQVKQKQRNEQIK